MARLLPKLQISQRSLVKELHRLLYDGKDGKNDYLFGGGVPENDLLYKFKQPALQRAVLGHFTRWKDVEKFKMLEFYLKSCIADGYIAKNPKDPSKLELTGKGYQLISWKHWVDFISENQVVPILIAILSLTVAIWSSWNTAQQTKLIQEQSNASTKQASTAFVINLNNELRNGSNSYSSVINAITNGYSLQGFSNQEIDNYLVIWELIDHALENGVLDDSSAYDAFSFDVEHAYCSPFIKSFVLVARKRDEEPEEYGGFTNLARNFLIEDGGKPCSPDFITNQNYL